MTVLFEAEGFTRKIYKVTGSERSASQVYRVTQRLWRGVEEPVLSVAEGTPRMLFYPYCYELFNHRRPHRRLHPAQWK